MHQHPPRCCPGGTRWERDSKVKGMSDTIQCSWFYVFNLEPPPGLWFQQTALDHKQFMFWVLPKPARHRQFLNKKHKIHILLASSDGEENLSHSALPTRTAQTSQGLNLDFSASHNPFSQRQFLLQTHGRLEDPWKTLTVPIHQWQGPISPWNPRPKIQSCL